MVRLCCQHKCRTPLTCCAAMLPLLDILHPSVLSCVLQHFPSILHQMDPSLPKGEIDVKMIDFGTAQLCKDGCSVAEGISGTPGMCACALPSSAALWGRRLPCCTRSAHVLLPPVHARMCVVVKLLELDHALTAVSRPFWVRVALCCSVCPLQCSWPPR